jgi:DNA-binding transcriptional MocR family regulator
VARYLEIGTEIAHRVRAGQLPAGTELPAIRETARTHATTASTIVRAYRYLADGGVITLADRRRAKVATHGNIAAARLLEADRVFRLAGSDDPALQNHDRSRQTRGGPCRKPGKLLRPSSPRHGHRRRCRNPFASSQRHL